MTWLGLALTSALFLGVYDVAKKRALSGRGRGGSGAARDSGNPVLPVLWLSSLCALGMCCAAALVGWAAPSLADRLALRVVGVPLRLQALVAVKALVVSTSWACNFKALKHLPLSLVSPLRASAPLFTLAGAVVLFDERPTALQLVGVGVVLASYGALSRVGRRDDLDLGANRYVGWLLLGTLLGACSGLYDKFLLRAEAQQLAPTTLQFWFTAHSALLFTVACAAQSWSARRAARRPRAGRTRTGDHAVIPPARPPFRWRWSIPAIALCLLLADQAYFHALAQPDSQVALVSICRRASAVVSFLLGAQLFNERWLLPKAAALGGVLAGITLIALQL